MRGGSLRSPGTAGKPGPARYKPLAAATPKVDDRPRTALAFTMIEKNAVFAEYGGLWVSPPLLTAPGLHSFLVA